MANENRVARSGSGGWPGWCAAVVVGAVVGHVGLTAGTILPHGGEGIARLGLRTAGAVERAGAGRIVPAFFGGGERHVRGSVVRGFALREDNIVRQVRGIVRARAVVVAGIAVRRARESIVRGLAKGLAPRWFRFQNISSRVEPGVVFERVAGGPRTVDSILQRSIDTSARVVLGFALADKREGAVVIPFLFDGSRAAQVVEHVFRAIAKRVPKR